MLKLRVDDRLIHTQVVAGWIQSLALNRIIVANDRAAADLMQVLALEMALPPAVSCSVCKVEDAGLHVLPDARQMVIVASLACASRVVAYIPGITEINLANCSRDRCTDKYQQFAASVWLTKKELLMLQSIKQSGINVVNMPVAPVTEK